MGWILKENARLHRLQGSFLECGLGLSLLRAPVPAPPKETRFEGLVYEQVFCLKLLLVIVIYVMFFSAFARSPFLIGYLTQTF